MEIQESARIFLCTIVTEMPWLPQPKNWFFVGHCRAGVSGAGLVREALPRRDVPAGVGSQVPAPRRTHGAARVRHCGTVLHTASPAATYDVSRPPTIVGYGRGSATAN